MVKHVDVAVIGTGFAGLSAALASRRAGARTVVLLEKQPTPGGNSIFNAGQVAVVGSEKQKEQGVDDSVELMVEDMRKAGCYMNDAALCRIVAERSRGTADWLMHDMHVPFRDRLTHMGGHSVPRILSTQHASGRDIVDTLLAATAADPGIELLLNAQVDTLLQDHAHPTHAAEPQPVTEDGQEPGGLEGPEGPDPTPRVVGACGHITPVATEAEQSPSGISTETEQRDAGEGAAQPFAVHAARGVVLAAGGFGADVEFRAAQHAALGADVMSTNSPGATAGALRAALRAGALPVQLSQIQLGPWTSPDEQGFGAAPLFCIGAGFPHGVVVDPATGKRIANELSSRKDRSVAILNSGHPAVCLTDAVGATHSFVHDLPSLAPTVQAFDSLEALAQHYGISLPHLQETIDEYNAGVAAGEDPLGKPLGRDVQPLAQPPFYATRLWPKVHHCMGGVAINHRAQVLDVGRQPIPGLYAAGEVAGGVHGADRLGGCATTECLTFGRIAGESVMDDVKAQPAVPDAVAVSSAAASQ